MTGNNNLTDIKMRDKNVMGLQDTNGYHSTDIGVSTVSPVDDTFVQVEVGPTTLSRQGYIEGYSIKEGIIKKHIKKINQKYVTQILLSILRNALCWAGLTCLVVMCAAGTRFKDWHHERLAAVVVIFAMGLVGAGFHVYRAYYDLTFQSPTLVAQMLRDALGRDEFIRKIQNRQLSAPELFIEVSLKSGALSSEDPNHWTRVGRKKCKELPYRGWADQSPSVHQFKWPESGAAWVIVSKDYRCVDDASKSSIESEVMNFRRETGYNDNSYFMNMEYILQWKENDACADAEVFLVYDDLRSSRSGFFNFDLYRASWIVALDSIFRILFHFKTKHLSDYYIVKFIER